MRDEQFMRDVSVATLLLVFVADLLEYQLDDPVVEAAYEHLARASGKLLETVPIGGEPPSAGTPK